MPASQRALRVIKVEFSFGDARCNSYSRIMLSKARKQGVKHANQALKIQKKLVSKD
jgi:hypothetical protein